MIVFFQGLSGCAYYEESFERAYSRPSVSRLEPVSDPELVVPREEVSEVAGRVDEQVEGSLASVEEIVDEGVVGSEYGYLTVKTAETSTEPSLSWEATELRYQAREGDISAQYLFEFINVTDRPVSIVSAKATCGCTTADHPPLPWKIEAGESGTILVNLNFEGVEDIMARRVTITTDDGVVQPLVVKAYIP